MNLLLFVRLGSSSTASSVRLVFLKKRKKGTLITFPGSKKTENNETNLLLFVRLGSSSMASSVRPVFLKKRKKGTLITFPGSKKKRK